MKNRRNLLRTLNKLEKEDDQTLTQFEKLDNRTNTFLSISLGVFSLQMTLLTGNIINIYNNYLVHNKNIILIITLFFILNILFNINSIVNFRKSSKISEELFANKKLTKITENLEKNTLIKEEIINYTENIKKNQIKINYKKEYINNGLNSILISLSLIAIITIIIFLIGVW